MDCLMRLTHRPSEWIRALWRLGTAALGYQAALQRHSFTYSTGMPQVCDLILTARPFSRVNCGAG